MSVNVFLTNRWCWSSLFSTDEEEDLFWNDLQKVRERRTYGRKCSFRKPVERVNRFVRRRAHTSAIHKLTLASFPVTPPPFIIKRHSFISLHHHINNAAAAQLDVLPDQTRYEYLMKVEYFSGTLSSSDKLLQTRARLHIITPHCDYCVAGPGSDNNIRTSAALHLMCVW